MTTITIRHDDGGFRIEFPYRRELVDAVKGLPQRRWDPLNKVWVTKDAAPLAALLARLSGIVVEAAPEVRDLLDRSATAKSEAIAASRATEAPAELDIPAPAGLAYLPYQRAGIAYASSRPATLIADDPGLGKTIQAIGVSNADPTIARVLVICPASLKINWAREWAKWSTRPMPTTIVNGKKFAPTDGVTVINFDVLKKHHAALLAVEWDLMIVDEAHALKNSAAKRTALVLGKWDPEPAKRIAPLRARRRVFLTGTPLVNRPVELWTLAKALDPHGLGASWMTYVKRYCAGKQTRWGWDVSGASHLEELQDKLRASIMVRRLKSEVLTELPAKRRSVVELPADGCESVITAETETYERTREAVDAARVAVALAEADDEAAYAVAVAKLRAANQVAFEGISKLRHATAVAKIPAVVDYLRGALDAGQKIVCFGHHLDVIEGIRAEFADITVTLIGAHSPEERQAAVDRFQTDETCRLFIGSLGAAGVGITLTASAHVIFAELDYVPGRITQAEDRCHRIGQAGSVLIEHLVLDGSLDARMAQVLVAKQAIIDAALDDQERAELAEIEITDPEETPAGKRRALLEARAAALDAEDIARIHAGLQTLAGMCDGANQKDGAGFNKLDARLGAQLACLPSLTPRQAALGERICRTYRKQLGWQ